jgi:hypothetical protein
MPLKIGDLRNDPVSHGELPKLDVAGSSPVARSVNSMNSAFDDGLPLSAGRFGVFQRCTTVTRTVTTPVTVASRRKRTAMQVV